MDESTGIPQPIGERAAATAWVRQRMSAALRLLANFNVSEDPRDLDRAIALARAVTEDARAAPPGAVERKACPACLNILAILLLKRCTACQRLDSRQESIECVCQAVEGLTDEDDSERVSYLGNLENLLVSKYNETLDGRHLVESIDIARRLADGSNPGTVDHALSLDMLRQLYTRGYEHTKDPDYLDCAIRAGESLVEHGTAMQTFWFTALNETEWLLHEKFSGTQEVADLDRAVQLSRMLVASGPTLQLGEKGDEYRLLSLRNLALSLTKLYRVTGQGRDLDAAMEAHARALKAASGADNEGLLALLWSDLRTLCSAVYDREKSFENLLNAAMLDAVHMLQSGRGPPFRYLLCGNEDETSTDQGELARYKARREAAARWLSGMAGVAEAEFERAVVADADELEMAILLTFQAMQLAGPSHPDWGRMETARRARWRRWSDLVGKIPGSEIMVLALGDGGTWIPPEVEQEVDMDTDAFVSTGREASDEHIFNPDPPTISST